MGAELINKAKMVLWSAKVQVIVSKTPGSNRGFSPESIARQSKTVFSKFSTWSIICEEVLDTQFPLTYFERARAELNRRGISDSEIQEMRRFAWLTAGWLNYECVLWEWVHLDEKDIYLAIEQQHTRGYISAEEKDRRIAFAKKYDVPIPTQTIANSELT